MGDGAEDACRADDEDGDGFTLGQLAAACLALKLVTREEIQDLAPAYLKMIYRTRRREMLREKEIDAVVVRAACNADASAMQGFMDDLRRGYRDRSNE